MRKPKEYVFKREGLLIELFLTVIYLLPVIIFCAIFYDGPFLMLLFILIPLTLLGFQFYSIYMIFQFEKYDKNKIVIIDETRSILKISKNNNTTVVNRTDVLKVEIYEQKSLGKFGVYNYMVLITNDGKQILLTQFTIPRLEYDNIFRSFIKKKPRTYFKKTFNFIDEKRFKP